MPILELNQQPEINIAALEATANRQRPRMLLAMALLLAALILVLTRYREFWLSPLSTAGTQATEQTADEAAANSRGPAAASTSRHAKSKPHAVAVPAASDLTAVISERSVLPPLQVEILSAAGRQILRTRIAGVKVEMPGDPSQTAAPADPVAAPEVAEPTAASQVRFSRETTRVVDHTVEPSYPALARQQSVQGSVVLLARIGTDGNIQDLQVLSGPEILSEAARDAVKQWHFKPYYVSGQPTETEARITVNFIVSTQ